ncbi:MAG: MerR family transcriptional regulator [Candidatus Riflebacteria bacterium]|nr:MerR family transcriptional regulator [Candidatus Riflebacteria bacterium]
MEDKKITIGQLAELTGLSRRAIRFYVQSGLLPAPAGAGRGHYYTDEHLQILQQICTLKENRHSLDEIAVIIKGPAVPAAEPLSVPTTWTRIEVCPGFEIQIQGGLYRATPARIRKLQKFVSQLFGVSITTGEETK